jgi:catechol 2,3-dioxygenase-like lactoylglutathione lyase family enzyme
MRFRHAHHIALYTSDLERLQHFYVNSLGMPIIGGFRGEPIIFLDAGGVVIELCGGETAVEPRGQGWSHFALEVEDLDAAVADLEGHGIAFHIPPMPFPKDVPVVRTAFFRDPDGNELELIQPLGARYPERDEL